MAYHFLLTQIVIDSTNRNLDFAIKYSGGTITYTAAVATGTYDSIFTLFTAITTAMQAADPGVATFTWTLSGTTGKATVVAAGAGLTQFSLLCSVTTNAIWDVLGFAEVADKTSALTYTSDYQVQNAWVMSRGPARDTYDRPRILGAETVVALSGAAERVTWSDQTVREVEWKVVPASRYLTRFASTNEAFEEVWEDMTHGYYVSYYTHAGSFVLEGKYALVCEGDERLEGDRLSPGAAYYNTPTLKLVKQS